MASNVMPTNMDDWIAIQEQQRKIERQQQMAQALQSQGYQPNSGGLGVLAGLISQFAGQRLNKQADEKYSDVLRKQFAQQQQQAEATRKQQLDDEERKSAREIAQETAKARAKAQADKEFALPKYDNGVIFDPSRGASTIDPNYAQVQGTLAQQRARAEAANRQAPEWQQKAAYLQAQGVPPDQINAMLMGQQQAGPFGDLTAATKAGIISPEEAAKAAREKVGVDQRQLAPTAEAKTKLALLDNAIANATKYRDRVVKPDGSFADIESMQGDTPQLIQSAVQDMLYAKSGASAPAAEVEKAHAMYAPSRTMGIPTERDSTAAAKVNNLINDLQRMRQEIGGGPATPDKPAAASTITPDAILQELKRRGVNVGG